MPSLAWRKRQSRAIGPRASTSSSASVCGDVQQTLANREAATSGCVVALSEIRARGGAVAQPFAGSIGLRLVMPVMRRSRRGETRVEFERFVDCCVGDLSKTAYLVTWDLAEAEDLVQETFLRVARRWPRVRGMDQPVAYARRILVNLALDDAKRRARRRSELAAADGARLDAYADEASARVLGAVDARAELAGALGGLAPRQRAVLVLRYFEDLSEAQVAEILGCSLGTVKSTASRGLARLRNALDEPAVASPAHGNGDLISNTKERQR